MSATNRLGGRVYGLLAGIAAVVSVVVAWVAASVTQVAVLDWKQAAVLVVGVLTVGVVADHLTDEPSLVKVVLGKVLRAAAAGALLGWLLALVSVSATTVLFVVAVLVAVQVLVGLVLPAAGEGAVGWGVAVLVTAFVGYNAAWVGALIGVAVGALTWVGWLALVVVAVWVVRTRGAAARHGTVDDAVREGGLSLPL